MSQLIDNLEKRLSSGQDDALLRFGLGSAYFNAKDFTAAAVHLRACIEQKPDYSAAYKLLGRALIELDDVDAAKAVLTEGMPVAEAAGDKQSQREMEVFLKKLDKR